MDRIIWILGGLTVTFAAVAAVQTYRVWDLQVQAAELRVAAGPQKDARDAAGGRHAAGQDDDEIGRASCRERV